MSRRPKQDRMTEILDRMVGNKPYVDRSAPCVWVGCLACYNEGSLVGEWVNGTEACEFIPCDKPGHEEFQCFDIENYHGFLKGEVSPSEAQRIAELLEDIDEENLEPFSIWVDNGSGSIEDYSDFEDQYRGIHDSLTDYAEEYVNDAGLLSGLDESLHCYFDFDSFARDLEHNGLWTADAPGGKVYVYDC